MYYTVMGPRWSVGWDALCTMGTRSVLSIRQPVGLGWRRPPLLQDVYYRTPRTTSTLQQLFITPNYHDHQARIVDGRRRWAPTGAYFRPPLLAAPPSSSSSSDNTSLLQQLPLVERRCSVMSACRLSSVVVNTSLYPAYMEMIAYFVLLMCPFLRPVKATPPPPRQTCWADLLF